METFIEFVVQSWITDYEFWSDCAQPRGEDENMFALSKVGHETEPPAREHLALLEARSPSGTYRLVKRTTTVEPI